MTATRPTPIAFVRSLLDVAIVGLVAVVLLAVILGRIVPFSGRHALIIAGPSMEPTLPLGSAVVAEPVSPDAIRIGDIVAVRNGADRAIFTHRVVRTLELQGEPYLETKGDNNPTPDGATVPAGAVVGRVTSVFPLMGYVLAWFSVPSGVASVLGLGAILIVAALVLESFEGERGRGRRWLGAGAALVTGAAPPLGAAGGHRPQRVRSKVALAAIAAAVVPDATLAALVDTRPRRPELGTIQAAGGARSKPRSRRGSRTTPAAT
jgi:signal peptidase